VSDYLVKPFDPAAFVALLRESRRLPASARNSPGAEPIPGVMTSSAAMREPTRLARALAATDAAILLTGEAGTGKDLFAHAIHAMSGRRGSFVRLDGASMRHPGAIARLQENAAGMDVFAEAAGGTLFIDG